mmetsp:Transcript_19998/g.55173  ORF Transcript_19998/g.55173 Transcript_19998/m.55173 type:complete len:200 (+) Transcript_19998:747-1346(+)
MNIARGNIRGRQWWWRLGPSLDCCRQRADLLALLTLIILAVVQMSLGCCTVGMKFFDSVVFFFRERARWLWLWLWLFLTVRMVVQLRQRRRHGLTQRGKVFGTGPVDIGPLLQFRLERPRFGAVALVPTLKFQQVSVQGRGQGRKGLRRLLGVEFAVQTGNGLWWVRRWFGRWIGIDAVVVVTVVVVTVVDVDIVGMLG